MSTVSVIIPVKNRAELLRKTLDNLLRQSLLPHEIIVVDDHSTDNIRQVIFDYITEATFLNNEGKGPGAARNLGLSQATGEYIQFFDSDDLMATDKLERQVWALEKSGADMAYGPYVKAEETVKGWIQKDVVMQWNAISENLTLTNAMLRGWNALTQVCLFRKSFLDGVPKWDENLITHEDYLYLFQLSLKNPKLIHVREGGVLYRQHGAQSTDQDTISKSRAKDRLQVLLQIRNELEQNRAGFVSKCLFAGRLKQAYDFLANQGEDMRAWTRCLHMTDPAMKLLYRIYNKTMRSQTRSDWEPMHGISTDPTHFQQIVKSCSNG